MQRFCPNCGNPVEQDEIFCDKCGTKVGEDSGGQETYQAPVENNYQAPPQDSYQTPPPGGYQVPPQNSYQPPTPSNYQNPPQYNYQTPYQYNAGQQNMNMYAPNPQYPPNYGSPKKSAGKKILIIASAVISVLAIIAVIFVIKGALGSKEPKSNPSNNPGNNPTTAPATNPTKSPTTTPKPTGSSNNPSTGKSTIVWNGNINAESEYKAAEKKIYVDYSLSLINNGTVKADNVKVYIDPPQGDKDAEYLGLKPKTPVNDTAASIKNGETKDLTKTFYYSNIESSKVTQEILQDIVNRYVGLPVLVEWQENAKTYTQTLTLQ